MKQKNNEFVHFAKHDKFPQHEMQQREQNNNQFEEKLKLKNLKENNSATGFAEKLGPIC